MDQLGSDPGFFSHALATGKSSQHVVYCGVSKFCFISKSRSGPHLLEAQGKNTPDLAGITDRLQQRNGELALQERLVTLEATAAPTAPLQLDAHIALEMVHEVVINGDIKQKRAFLGAFLESICLRRCGRASHTSRRHWWRKPRFPVFIVGGTPQPRLEQEYLRINSS
jgi:hypothetical protein